MARPLVAMKGEEEKTLQCIGQLPKSNLLQSMCRFHSCCVFEQKRKMTETTVSHFMVWVCVIILNNEC